MANKYDCFFHKASSRLIRMSEVSLDELERMPNGSMFCPECRMAELRYNHGSADINRKPFLYAPNNDHDANCYYLHDEASEKTITRFLADVGKDKAENQLKNIIRYLRQLDETTSSPDEPKPIHDSNPFVVTVPQMARKQYRIRRKSLLDLDNEEPQNTLPTIYYARNVYVVRCEEPSRYPNGRPFNNLYVYRKLNDEPICRIYRKYTSDKIDPSRMTNIAVLGRCKLDSQGYKITLEYGNDLIAVEES